MRVLSKGRLARAIAHLLTVTFVWSAWLMGVGATPATAQIATRAATTDTVAVVPFENLTGMLPETLGEKASAAVATELRDRLLLDVLPKADVTLQMSDLGITAPISDVELVRLAAELEIPLMIAGQIRAARIVRSPEGRYAEVVLAVRLFDRVARANVNGALITAKGPASPDASDDVLLGKALSQAAFEAVEEMKSRPTITSKVFWSRGDTVFMGVGSRGGLRPGIRMVAIRDGKRIGVVRITESDATGSYADVVEGMSLRTGDFLRAIYELPSAARQRPARVIEKTGKRFEKMLLAAAILFGLGGHASGARMLVEGGIAVPAFATSNLANATETGRGGWFPSLVYPGQLIPIASTLSTWESYSGTEKPRILVYEIWRNEQLTYPFLVSVEPDSYYIDGAMWPGAYGLTISIDALTGEITEITPEGDIFVPEYDDETGEFDWDAWDSFVDGYSDQAGIAVDDLSISYLILVGPDWSGPVAGMFYTYRVLPVVMEQMQVATGTYEWRIERFEGEFSSSTNGVVPVAPPFTDSIYYVQQPDSGVYEEWDWFPNPELLGNLATFYFYSPVGADEMIVQVARDPNITFDPSAIYSEVTPVVYGYGDTVEVDLTQVPGTGDIFWWRIGARNRRSVREPRPYPSHLTNDYGWVWSERLAFSPVAISRASLLHEEREALAASRARAVRIPRRAAGERIHRAE